MAKVLILYGTTEGHTAKVAQFVADVGRRAGHDVRVVHGASIGSDVDFASADAVLVAASVYEGRHQAYVRDWIHAHRWLLTHAPSGFIQVSLVSTIRDPEHDREARAVVERMSETTGWKPAHVAYVAGALKYTQYSWMKRMLMKQIARSQGGDTDTSKDYEYTDWPALERWSESFFASIRPRAEASASA